MARLGVRRTQCGVNALKDLVIRGVNVLHRAVFMGSGGRVAGKGMGMPVVMLQTTGRKTGKVRTTMLTTPLEDGDRVILVASYGGDDRHPSWFLNLRDNPDVELTLRGQTRKMRATVASPEERAELWPRVTKDHRNYAGYQTRTEREIPLVIVEPV
jgi:deazaflavin-dependent oxidoreductase (nitroreductase family)